MLNASAAVFNFNRLSYDNYAWPGTPDPHRINHLGRSRNDSQVFIYFVLINARNWLRLVALAGNEGRGAAELWKIGEKGRQRPRKRAQIGRDAGGLLSSRNDRHAVLSRVRSVNRVIFDLCPSLRQIFCEATLLSLCSLSCTHTTWSISACILCLLLYTYSFDISRVLIQSFDFFSSYLHLYLSRRYFIFNFFISEGS